MRDNIYIFKLTNGEFCIGNVVDSVFGELTIDDMRTLIAHPQGVQIVPFMFCNPKRIVLSREHIITETNDIEKGLLDFYKQQVTGIVVAGSGPLKLVQ